ncbi:hypothetical protein Hanom_Chr05g00457621 [Helianthus anomalus]
MREVPRTKNKGHLVLITSKEKPDETTSSGKSDDPVKLGDDLKYTGLTERVTKIENSVGEIKTLLQQLLASKSESNATTFAALQQVIQPMFQQHQKPAELKFKFRMQEMRNMVDARYVDTLADIQAIKAQLLQPTSTPAFILVNEDDAK